MTPSTHVPRSEDRRILGSLLADGEAAVAFLRDEEAVWFARGIAAPHEPRSPVVDLVQGLWEVDPANARSLVRRRIFTSYAPTAMDRDLVKVAAKKIFGPLEPEGRPGEGLRFESVAGAARQARERAWQTTRDLPEPRPGPGVGMQRWIAHVELLASLPDRRGPRHASDRAVGCLLLDRDGEPLAQACNTNGTNRTLHAEVNLIQAWFRDHQRPLPPSSTLLTSLQPCRMCASMVVQACAEPASLEVLYLQPDPGRMACDTAIARAARERWADSIPTIRGTS